MRVTNKKARFNYRLLEKLEAGVSLTGIEAKAARKGHINLTNSFAKIIDNQVYLINASISTQGSEKYNPTRTRKLLLHKKQITSIQSKIKAKKLTLVPVSMYTKGQLVKVELALAKTKRKFEKRRELKKKTLKREIERELTGT
jgi:SsrA-binding protein